MSAALCATVIATAAATGEVATIRLVPGATLPSCPGLEFYRVETAAATYFLEKSGAGLAAMIDPEGHDWIGFNSAVGSRSAGEFRGFPNAVHRQAGNYFHPKNASTGETVTTVEYAGPDRVTIGVVSDNGLWAGRYDFFPTHCMFTMTKMPPEFRYWVLYEGTPGGKFDTTDWSMTAATPAPQPVTVTRGSDILGPEWIVFGDQKMNRVLFLLHHTDDAHADGYFPMDNQMTVFGFGRQKAEKLLSTVPQHFSIGFLETTDHTTISRKMSAFLSKTNP